MDELQGLSLSDIKVGGKPLAAAEPETKPDSQPAGEPTGDNNQPDNGGQAGSQQDAAQNQPDPVKPEPVKKPDVPADKPVAQPAPEYKFKDDFIKGAVDYYERTGDLTPYLRAKTVDFLKMSDLDIMRHDMREQFPTVSDKAFEHLFKQEVFDKFKLSEEEYGAEQSDLGKELLKLQADKIRSKYLEWQKGFTAPPVTDTPEENEESQRQELFVQDVNNSELTKSLLKDKRVVFGEGDGAVNYEVDPDSIVEMTIDNNKFFSLFKNESGGIDYNKWYKVVAFAKHIGEVEKILFNNGKAAGREEIAKEIKNTDLSGRQSVPADGGGDERDQLLNAFLNRGIKK